MSLTSQTALGLVLNRLSTLHPKLIDLGLERTVRLSQKCGAPHEQLPPVIHIAGTNGKGSVTAFLRALYEAAGLKAHIYNSPHLCRFNERIRLAGQLIEDEALIALLEEVEQVNKGEAITFFEITTIAAFLAFSRHKADVLILETGLGGLYDSTNIIEQTALSVITPIARDHEHFLGSNLGDIARQKAGIMRADAPTIWAHQTDEVLSALHSEAESRGCCVYYEGVDFTAQKGADGQLDFNWQGNQITLPKPALNGYHQYQNAGLALAAFKMAHPDAFSQRMLEGIGKAVWPGRFQLLNEGRLAEHAKGQLIFVDGAHNAHGADALVKSMAAITSTKWQVIFGALNTRPAEDFLAQIAPVTKNIYTLTIPDQPAALSADDLARTATQAGLEARPCQSVIKALDQAIRHKNSPIIICGSLYLAGHVLSENETLPD